MVLYVGRMGFSRKKLLRISICLKYRDLFGVFYFFCIDFPGNPWFFLNFWCTTQELFYSTTFTIPPLEFSIDILNRGVLIFFLENSNFKLTKPQSTRDHHCIFGTTVMVFWSRDLVHIVIWFMADKLTPKI